MVKSQKTGTDKAASGRRQTVFPQQNDRSPVGRDSFIPL
ncbi:hypothetical protein NBRC3293_0871 [Gluconobacter oxydans NBRC 3293]|uniref:Uncharacterized protein n=1 Tax=Gluconobacter oxydans NBRC 3293 TaxID=1315969 RepID=A0A829WWY6_GLUOY|nr:hypothetical protein NBRC3293_0871 [Gluconobacter oxydans NBRC 3293]